MSLQTSDWADWAPGLNHVPAVYPLIDPELEWVPRPREEIVERTVALLMPMMGCGLHSAEAGQLRQVLLNNPQITSMRQLQDYLSGAERAPEHRSAEMDEVAQVIDRWGPQRPMDGQL